MKTFRLIATGLLVGTVFALTAAPSTAQVPLPTNPVELGAYAGVASKTVDGTMFSLGLHADYFVTPSISVGPMGVLSSGQSLIEGSAAAVARYHIRTPYLHFVPFAGVGAIHADILNSSTWGLYVPVGVTAEYPVRGTILTATAMVNLHNLEFDELSQTDPKSYSLLFGVRFDP